MKKIIILFSLIISINNSFAITSLENPTIIDAHGKVEVAFSPNGGVTKAIISEIDRAKHTILVEAYSFTSKDIAGALLNAKKRGINIRIILDKSQVGKKYSSATFFSNLGFNLHIDYKHAIFHNKVMIIDDNAVITGSFNFTNAAEKKNSENLLILSDNNQLASIYTKEFNHNWQNSLDYNEFIKLNNTHIKYKYFYAK
ncbi:MAG: phospholipase D family protein [Neisseriaceae bacterium]